MSESSGSWEDVSREAQGAPEDEREEVSVGLEHVVRRLIDLQMGSAHAMALAAVTYEKLDLSLPASRDVMTGADVRLRAELAVRQIVGQLPSSRTPEQLQVLPIRLPESLHERLKTWCKANGFSMAVVVRGLLERFLAEQDRSAS